MLLTAILGTLATLSFLLGLWQLRVARCFPLHARNDSGGFAPGVTLLKPLKGSDAEVFACLESWLLQDYPGRIQTLFGVASADDPACEVVRKLLAAHPRRDAQLVVCAEEHGPNRKVSTLVQLQRLIRHELVVISDADVRVPPDFLGQLVGPLRDGQTGLVTCFYRLANPATLAMRWEAFAVNGDFWSQVLQARSLKPLDFALGAAMATNRAQLKRLGGFASLVDFLADDYQLGHLIAKGGARIELCTVVAECWSAPMSWGEVWAHQLRWARTIRVCQPLPYFFSILSNATLWPLLWLVTQPRWPAMFLGGIYLVTRMASGFFYEKRLTGRGDFNSSWLALVKDLLQLVIWVLAFVGSHVTWRGERFRVLSGGKLAKSNSATDHTARG